MFVIPDHHYLYIIGICIPLYVHPFIATRSTFFNIQRLGDWGSNQISNQPVELFRGCWSSSAWRHLLLNSSSSPIKTWAAYSRQLLHNLWWKTDCWSRDPSNYKPGSNLYVCTTHIYGFRSAWNKRISSNTSGFKPLQKKKPKQQMVWHAPSTQTKPEFSPEISQPFCIICHSWPYGLHKNDRALDQIIS